MAKWQKFGKNSKNRKVSNFHEKFCCPFFKFFPQTLETFRFMPFFPNFCHLATFFSENFFSLNFLQKCFRHESRTFQNILPLKKGAFFPPPLGLFGYLDHILQNICLKLGMTSFLVHMHIF